MQVKSAAILEPISKRLLRHPGVTHYLFDATDLGVESNLFIRPNPNRSSVISSYRPCPLRCAILVPDLVDRTREGRVPKMELGVFEAIYSARALRKFKPDPVSEAVITQILDAAIRAPSAGNAQNWAFIVVRDAERRRKLGAIYRKASEIASAMYAARGRPAHLTEQQFHSFMSSGAYLWDHMGDAPVILVVCQVRPILPPPDALPLALRNTFAREQAYAERIRGASIYPAVQNIILACRALGLGTTITTNHIRCEDEVKSVLNIPDEVQTFAMMPIGYPQGVFGPVQRRPVSDVAYAECWAKVWPGGPDG
jgi:nitroreductase